VPGHGVNVRAVGDLHVWGFDDEHLSEESVRDMDLKTLKKQLQARGLDIEQLILSTIQGLLFTDSIASLQGSAQKESDPNLRSACLSKNDS
jgi:hypothetical protein